MLKPWQFWTVTALAAILLALVVINMVLYRQNRNLQNEIAERAQYIQQSTQLGSLFQEIVKALAELSVRKQDSALADLLTRHGFSVSVNPPVAAPAQAGLQDDPKKATKGK